MNPTITNLLTPTPLILGYSEILNQAHSVNSEELALAIKALPYPEFTATLYWQAIAQAVKERDGKRCCVCNSPQRLEAHHRTYERHGYEHMHLGDMTTLCRKHHQMYHDAKNGKSVIKHKRRKDRFYRKAAIKLMIAADTLEKMGRAKVEILLSERRRQREIEREQRRHARFERKVARLSEDFAVKASYQGAGMAAASEPLITIDESNFKRLRCTKEEWHWMARNGIDPMRGGWARRAIGFRVPARYLNPIKS